MTKQSIRRSECPITFGLDLFGDKWTLLILRDMLLFGEKHFKDFAQYEGIATNVLSDRLSRLEKSGVITKQRDETLKNQNIYQPTDKGRAMLPMLTEMMMWGLGYDEQTPASKTFVCRLAAEREQIVKEAIQAAESRTFTDYRREAMGIDPNLYEV